MNRHALQTATQFLTQYGRSQALASYIELAAHAFPSQVVDARCRECGHWRIGRLGTPRCTCPASIRRALA